MKHLKLDEILAYLDNSISDDLKNTIEDHISECDKCFGEYSIYKMSYDKIKHYQLPVPSQDTIKAVENTLHPQDNPDDVFIVESITTKITNFLSRPSLAPIMGIAIIIFIFSPDGSTGKSTTYLNYGWFEDNILNREFGFSDSRKGLLNITGDNVALDEGKTFAKFNSRNSIYINYFFYNSICFLSI